MSAEGGFSESLGQKIGPLPGWGWALVIGGGLGLSMLLRKKSTATVAPSTAPAAVVGGTSGADTGTGSPLTSASDLVPYTDNNTWGLAVETALLQAGAEPTLVDQAVRDYLAGDTLTPEESVLIGQALNKVGPPPELLPPTGPPSVTDPTTSTQPTTAATPAVVSPGAASGTAAALSGVLGTTAGGTPIPAGSALTGEVAPGGPVFQFTAGSVPGATPLGGGVVNVPGFGDLPAGAVIMGSTAPKQPTP